MADVAIQVAATALSLLATLALTGWFFRQADRVPETVDGGAFVMRYPAAYAWLGWTAIAFFGLCAVAATTAPGDERWIALGFVPFVAMGAALLLSAKRTHAVVDPGGLVLHAWTLPQPLALRWADVERGSFSRWGYLVLHARDGKPARLSAGLVGTSRLPDVIAASLRVPGADEAVEKLRQFRSAYGG